MFRFRNLVEGTFPSSRLVWVIVGRLLCCGCFGWLPLLQLLIVFLFLLSHGPHLSAFCRCFSGISAPLFAPAVSNCGMAHWCGHVYTVIRGVYVVIDFIYDCFEFDLHVCVVCLVVQDGGLAFFQQMIAVVCHANVCDGCRDCIFAMIDFLFLVLWLCRCCVQCMYIRSICSVCFVMCVLVMSGMPAMIYTWVLLLEQPGGGMRAMAIPVSSLSVAPGDTSWMTL